MWVGDLGTEKSSTCSSSHGLYPGFCDSLDVLCLLAISFHCHRHAELVLRGTSDSPCQLSARSPLGEEQEEEEEEEEDRKGHAETGCL